MDWVGDTLAAADWDGNVELWNTTDHSLAQSLTVGTAPVRMAGLALSGDGSHLAAAFNVPTSLKSAVWVLAAEPDATPTVFQVGAQPAGLQWRGKLVAVGTGVGVDLLDPTLDGASPTHLGTDWMVKAISLDPTGAVAASGDAGHVAVWNADHSQRFEAPAAPLDGNCVAVAPGRVAVAACGGLELWTDLSLRVVVGADGCVRAVALGPDGSRAAWGDAGGNVVLTDTATGEALPGAPAPLPHENDPNAIAYSPDGELAIGYAEGTLRLLPAGGGDPVDVKTGSSGIKAVAWSAEGSQVATGASKTVSVWTAAGEPAGKIEKLDGRVRGLALHPDGDLIALALKKVDGVQVRSLSSGEIVSTAPGEAEAVAWSPDGRQLALAGRNRPVSVWTRSDGTVRDVGPAGARAVRWDPHGRALVVTGASTEVIRVSDGAAVTLLVMPVGDSEVGLALGPDQTFTGDAAALQHLRLRAPDGTLATPTPGSPGDDPTMLRRLLAP